MNNEKIYPFKDGKGYMRVIETEYEITSPKTLDEAIQRVKDMFEFDKNDELMNKMIEQVKTSWKEK